MLTNLKIIGSLSKISVTVLFNFGCPRKLSPLVVSETGQDVVLLNTITVSS